MNIAVKWKVGLTALLLLGLCHWLSAAYWNDLTSVADRVSVAVMASTLCADLLESVWK